MTQAKTGELVLGYSAYVSVLPSLWVGRREGNRTTRTGPTECWLSDPSSDPRGRFRGPGSYKAHCEMRTLGTSQLAPPAAELESTRQVDSAAVPTAHHYRILPGPLFAATIRTQRAPNDALLHLMMAPGCNLAVASMGPLGGLGAGLGWRVETLLSFFAWLGSPFWFWRQAGTGCRCPGMAGQTVGTVTGQDRTM